MSDGATNSHLSFDDLQKKGFQLATGLKTFARIGDETRDIKAAKKSEFSWLESHGATITTKPFDILEGICYLF